MSFCFLFLIFTVPFCLSFSLFFALLKVDELFLLQISNLCYIVLNDDFGRFSFGGVVHANSL